MGEERGEPPSPEESSGPSGESVRRRLAEARESLAAGMREAVEGFEREQAIEREQARERLDALVAERLDAAERTNLARIEELEGRVAKRVGALEAGMAQRFRDFVAEAARAGAAEGEAGAQAEDRVVQARAGLDDELARKLDRAVESIREDVEQHANRLDERVHEALASAERSLRNTATGALSSQREVLVGQAERVRAEIVAESKAAAEAAAEARLGRAGGRLEAELEGARESLASQSEAATRAKLDEATTELGEIAAQRAEAAAASAGEEAKSSLVAVQAAEARVTKDIAATAEKLSLRSRRQELKLARQESSKRIEAAISAFEQRADRLSERLERTVRAQSSGLDTEARGHLEALGRKAAEGSSEIEARLAAGDDQVALAVARVSQGVRRSERALGEIAESERRIISAQTRIIEVERTIAVAARTASDASDADARLRAATAAESEAARRIHDAERRLRDLLRGDE